MYWIFGYGSLIWNPGFRYLDKQPAVLRGYHRAYMMVTTRNRGCADCPGMVVTLAPGREVRGMAYWPDPEHLEETLAYLDQREGAGRAHNRVIIPLELDGGDTGRMMPAWTYLPIATYTNYVGSVPIWRQAQLVAQGAGGVGTSFDYLRRLMAELAELGVREAELEALFEETCRLLGADRAAALAACGQYPGASRSA